MMQRHEFSSFVTRSKRQMYALLALSAFGFGYRLQQKRYGLTGLFLLDIGLSLQALRRLRGLERI